jgi:predicted nucleic acid-binding protein
MPKTFVDTVAWIALVNTRDSLHEKTKEVLANLRRQDYKFVTTEFVLLEFANALSAPDFRRKASAFIEGLQKMADIEIIPASSGLFSLGFELYKNRPDKEWSLTDCTSLVVMEETKITEAFTGEHHFEQAGFIKLL